MKCSSTSTKCGEKKPTKKRKLINCSSSTEKNNRANDEDSLIKHKSNNSNNNNNHHNMKEEQIELVNLSVWGENFCLPVELLTSQDWLLSKIITSKIPWTKDNDGRIYLNRDPNTFRNVLYYLRHQSLPPLLNSKDLELLKSEAKYLNLPHLLLLCKKTQKQDLNKMQLIEQENERLKRENEHLLIMHRKYLSYKRLRREAYECGLVKRYKCTYCKIIYESIDYHEPPWLGCEQGKSFEGGSQLIHDWKLSSDKKKHRCKSAHRQSFFSKCVLGEQKEN